MNKTEEINEANIVNEIHEGKDFNIKGINESNIIK